MIRQLLKLTKVRFVLVGGFCGGLQIALAYSMLEIFTEHDPITENFVNFFSFVIAVQCNYFLSTRFTWRENIGDLSTRHTRQKYKDYIGFNAMMLGTLLFNQSTFALVNKFVPALIAVVAGILVAALSNWLISSRILFRSNQQV